MKNLIGKIKGTDYKGLMVKHGEKIALGLSGLVAVLVCILGTWRGYDKKPEELKELATKAKATIENSVFPEQERSKFQASTYYAKAEQMLGPLEGVGYGYGTPFTWSLRPRQERNKDPEHLAVEHLIAAYGKVLLYSNAAVAPETEGAGEMSGDDEETGDENSRRDGGSRRGAGTAAGPNSTTGSSRMKAPASVMELSGEGAASAEEEVKPNVEGRQFISVRGVFPLNKQAQRYMRALHTDNIIDATADVKIVDFKIQRQKIVPGDKPFSGPWEDLDYKTALEVLDAAGNIDDDVVDSRVIDNSICMPLPERIVGYWTEALASHPELKTFELSKEEMEEERKQNEKLMEEYGKMEGADADDPRTKRGFASRMVDVRGIRSAVMSNPEASRGMYGGGAGAGRRPQMSAPSMPAPMAIVPGGGGHGGGAAPMRGPGPAGARNSAQAVEEARFAAAGKLLLFRYLDFDVEPGEAYRYRVRLEFANPNFGYELDQVASEDVAEGETRWGDWSEPCQAVVVEKEYDFYLTDVDRGRGKLPSAKLAMFQWLRDVGSYINTTAVQPLVVGVGAYVGGKGKSTLLEPAVPSMKKEQNVSFNSQDVLVDVAPAPQMLVAEHPDLQLTSKRTTRPIAVVPDEAVVVDQFGQMLTLDDINGKKQEKKAEAMVDRERKEFDDLLESEGDESSQLDKMTKKMADGGEKPKKGKKGPSPLQRGGAMIPPPPPPPGTTGVGSGSGSGRKPRRGGGASY